MHSRITSLSWEIGMYPWWNGTDVVNKSSLEFYMDAVITNTQSEAIYSPHTIFLDYEGTVLPNHTLSLGPAGMAINFLFNPGRNIREYRAIFTFIEEWITEPPPGKFTFWVSDFNTTTDYSTKTIRIYDSTFLNFLRYDYEYIIIGIVSLATLGVVSWYSVKKIHFLRLNPILTRKLDDIKFITDQANFEDATVQLEDIFPEIERLNDITLNQRWNELKKRCTMNIEMQNKIDSIKNENGMESKKDKLLVLLKEIHTPHYREYIDPSIESEIVETLKMLD
ncbi:MAG: hypothetical protein ACTSRE_04250 [Promethearchaeota archaeon]